MVSVRTLLPLAEYVCARLSDSGEGVDGTTRHSAELAVRAGIAGLAGDPGAESVADDDTDNTAASGETGGAATPVKAVRRRRAGRGESR
jgi:hypothetical protein